VYGALDVFAIIGPTMIGPSSSHTAGAVRLGNLAGWILGERPQRAKVILYNSFASTGYGHGTDRALIAGLLGFAPDDERIRNAFAEATALGLHWELCDGGRDENLHPNTVCFMLTGAHGESVVTGCSVGGGRVKILSVDGFATDFSGEYATVLTVHRDRPGVVAAVTACLAAGRVNIAQMRVSRQWKGEKALMVIETDQPLSTEIKAALQKMPDICRVSIIQPSLEGR